MSDVDATPPEDVDGFDVLAAWPDNDAAEQVEKDTLADELGVEPSKLTEPLRELEGNDLVIRDGSEYALTVYGEMLSTLPDGGRKLSEGVNDE